jgi:hypothetical protein
MRILFDQGTPVPLKQHFPDHQVQTAFELGWSRLTNGDLLVAAEKQFDVIVTTDQNLRSQQSLAGRRLAVLVMPTTSWPRLQNRIDEIVKALTSLDTGGYHELPR